MYIYDRTVNHHSSHSCTVQCILSNWGKFNLPVEMGKYNLLSEWTRGLEKSSQSH
jgi:hypothetical protein